MNKDWLLTHYTDSRNVSRIQKTRALKSAWCLMEESGEINRATERRGECLELKSGAILRDQQPLTMDFVRNGDTIFAEYVKHLNQHVFFWSDSDAGNQSRQNFRQKYRYPKNIGLRCKLSDLVKANPHADILFSRYNSGTTERRSSRKLRCTKPFQSLESHTTERVVEIVVRGEICLPDNTEIECKKDKWSNLFTA